MPYSDFTLKRLRSELGINNKLVNLFDSVEAIKPSDWLVNYLKRTSIVNIQTEKAKSEAIVFPILLELQDRNKEFITLYSGNNLNADIDKGLNGECDFIISQNTESYDINFPIMQLVEAKNNDIQIGIPQCAAQMVGAKVYNTQNETNIDTVYGCVTTADAWLFMKLENNMLFIDKRKYYLNELGELLSIFQRIIDFYKKL